jgi:GntR family transcriptional repressor for pyruvate dehydrogenase complex
MPAPPIDPIHYTPSYQLAADQIRRAIELGTYVPGDRLPPSRDLAQQLGISVATLREAIRGLLDEGLVEMRRGPKGGLVVLRRPQLSRSKRVLNARLAEAEEILDFREAVECHAARLAATRRTDADLERLQEAMDRMTELMERPEDRAQVPLFNRADAQFHRAIAAAARNELLGAAVDDGRLRMFVAIGAALRHLAPDANDMHDDILREIRRGRAEPAARAMAAHIQVTREGARRMVQSAPRSRT